MYREWSAGGGLGARVACLWARTAESGGSQPVVPDGCVDVMWGPRGAVVAGPDTAPHPVRLVPGDSYFGIRFRPGAVGDVLGLPVAELRDQRVPLAGLPGFAGIEAAGPADVWAATLARLRETSPPDPAAPAIAAALRRGARIGEVARDLGLSERHLHRRCVGAFGYGPKVVQRVARFQRALRLARAGRPLAEVAADSGYADQAHMANEVRRLAGVPIRALL
ncbi:AraC-like DNA-binding protein [Thermocatellispora tengchongensis]|uniref:AraC-like DNA-binding protein n=1 Tax=Thermocatellispora tengchongensis TaxID=1073253 RepID=A0A840PAA8_9ACTN|nr:AraC family transcriptional regulator [Thermocatellispora tengchongensis]MBB5138324.1 AraC-like DNA-binding protein [Thermocatellispora tengchongensis]